MQPQPLLGVFADGVLNLPGVLGGDALDLGVVAFVARAFPLAGIDDLLEAQPVYALLLVAPRGDAGDLRSRLRDAARRR